MKFALPEPCQPPEKDWHFIDSLKTPLWNSIVFQRTQPRRNEISIEGGVSVQALLPDADGVLLTAYNDLGRFFDAARIPRNGSYPIVVQHGETECHEAYRIEIRADGCAIIAADTEGARRGIFFLQDEMLRTGGPFLPLGITERKPQIRTRLSRCFFGPINRPPKNRDELTDEIDYYPDEYLSRLAYQGVNGLWLTISFKDLCPSSLFPEAGRDSARRLAKLRRTVQKCARYGIKIYVFCIEPRGFGTNPEYLNSITDLERHPELGGHRVGDITYFCPGTPKAQAYLEESTFHLFSNVPGLGGMLSINLGERPTHCGSALVWDFAANNCPRCSKLKPWEVFRDTLTPLWRGIHRANPKAELISWLYVPYLLDRKERSLKETEKLIENVAAHFPENVTLQYNFESMGTIEQLGKKRMVRDYSLAYVGPSEIFTACAKALKKRGVRMSAKLQVGCSHEVATVPFVPVPGNLFRKYRAMHELGVSGAMQSWYFGSYPSLMAKAAGELSFAPLPATEEKFLQRLAAISWGEDGPVLARAWLLFSEAYRNFPANLTFAWYGPVHDAVAWPLHLKPVDTPIAPSWLLGHPPSGDRIGECIGFEHHLEEVIVLCEQMHRTWSEGLQLLLPLLKKYHGRIDHVLEIGVAQAVGIQIRSALNVLKFYSEREKLYSKTSPVAPEESLKRLRCLVEEEIENSKALEKLSLADSRLGFHSEAEGYKYFPAKLRWRTLLLEGLLSEDFPEMEGLLRQGTPLPLPFEPPPEESCYQCPITTRSLGKKEWMNAQAAQLRAANNQQNDGWRTTWQAVHDGQNLHFRVDCAVPPSATPLAPSKDFADIDYLRISIEPRRFWPTRDFLVGSSGAEYFDSKEVPLDQRWSAKVSMHDGGWQALISISLDCLEISPGSWLRLNVERIAPELGSIAWVPRHPTKYRLIFGDARPEDFGWICLQSEQAQQRQESGTSSSVQIHSVIPD